MGSAGIQPFSPSYILITWYTGLILSMFCFISVLLSFEIRVINNTSMEHQVKVSMIKPVFWIETIFFMAFLACLLLSILDSKLKIINFFGLEPVERRIGLWAIAFNCIAYLIILGCYLFSKKKLLLRTMDVTVKKNAYSIVVALLVFSTLFPAVETLLLGHNYYYYKNLLLVHVACAIFLYFSSFVYSRKNISQFLRWVGLSVVIAWFSFCGLRCLVARQFVPSAMEYCHNIIEVVEDTKTTKGYFPVQLPISAKLQKPPLLIKQQEQIYFHGEGTDFYVLEFWESPDFYYCYSSKNKKWEYGSNFLWR